MKNDPGLFTDSTGEGIAGGTDLRFETQNDLKQTIYNGSKPCKGCGNLMNPIESLSLNDTCPSCNRRSKANLVRGRMA